MRDRLQQAISHGVSERVVNHLEAVQVQKHHGKFLLAASCMGDGQFQPVFEQSPIR